MQLKQSATQVSQYVAGAGLRKSSSALTVCLCPETGMNFLDEPRVPVVDRKVSSFGNLAPGLEEEFPKKSMFDLSRSSILLFGDSVSVTNPCFPLSAGNSSLRMSWVIFRGLVSLLRVNRGYGKSGARSLS